MKTTISDKGFVTVRGSTLTFRRQEKEISVPISRVSFSIQGTNYIVVSNDPNLTNELEGVFDYLEIYESVLNMGELNNEYSASFSRGTAWACGLQIEIT